MVKFSLYFQIIVSPLSLRILRQWQRKGNVVTNLNHSFYLPRENKKFSKHGSAVSNEASGRERHAKGVPQSSLEDVARVLPDTTEDVVAGLAVVGIFVNLNKNFELKFHSKTKLNKTCRTMTLLQNIPLSDAIYTTSFDHDTQLIVYCKKWLMKTMTMCLRTLIPMGVRRGRQKWTLAPLADQNSMFFDILNRKQYVFSHF